MLVACAEKTVSPSTDKRDLPVKPSWAQPVFVGPPKAGENAIAVIGRERGGRLANAGRLKRFGQWYDNVRAGYGGAK
ncbi:MAG: hypothetical protein WC100_07030 [Sterolibacterium sp.]